ncbi:MAG: hypothetical protein LC785_03130 [Acidobacteria bacterium]|nr:hypothetical protein [Acidobacteriota bacterium]MCA1632841.1 hypothetical protein [Acidobacteriota bacterium]MCA1640977.1 hypothetical protein [Acidobacteriota bacterium]
MTVQIVENWADIKGKVLDHYPSKTVDGFVTVELKVSDVKNVEGFRNMLDDRQGDVIYLNVPEAVWHGLEAKAGAKVSCRVRMAGSRNLFAHPERVKVE